MTASCERSISCASRRSSCSVRARATSASCKLPQQRDRRGRDHEKSECPGCSRICESQRRSQEEPGNRECAERVRCHTWPAPAKQGREGDGEAKRQVRFVNANDPLERKPHARSGGDGDD